MSLPFDVTQFFAVFASYNTAVWPAQIVLTGLAVAAVVLALRSHPWSDRAVSGALALFWIWMGLVYHVAFFGAINPAATVFGALFILEGVALVLLGGFGRRLRFRFQPSVQGAAGALLLAYSLVGYPLLAFALGHRYPATPTFGLPCPTTIFTIGLLLWAERPLPRSLMAVPLAWSAIGTSAAILLGVWEDLGLGVAGLVSGLLIIAPRLGDARLPGARSGAGAWGRRLA